MPHSHRSKNRRLRNALRYASRGWTVLPLFGIVEGRCECGDLKCRRPGKHPRTKHGLNDATTNRRQIKEWWHAHPSSNIGIVTGSAVGPTVIDVDGSRGKREWRRLLRELSSLDVSTLTAVTGNGKHYYFTADGRISNSSGKLGKGIDVRGVGGYVVGVGSRHISGSHYEWKDPTQRIQPIPKQLLQLLERPRSKSEERPKSTAILRGERNTTLTRFAGVMRRPGMSYKAIKAALLAENRRRCNPPLPEEEVKSIAYSVARYSPVSTLGNWPEPLSPQALYGIFGEIVAIFASRSEVDPVGVLVHALTFAGSAMGSSAHIRVASDRHRMNIFAVTVGETAKARKMSAFNHVHQLFRIADPAWVDECIETGLSSGEGLIQSVLEKKSVTKIGSDPTLLVFEPEFGSVLRVIQRQGTTTSPVARQAWDGTSLGVMTRRDPLKAPASHISLIGHITRLELTDLLTRRDIFGGLANRILWVCVRRNAVRSELRGISDNLLRGLAQKIKSAIHKAEEIGELTFNAEAQKKWKEIYPSLSLEQPGLLGAITSRAEAQVLRLAGIYAVMDEQRHVQEPHLEAALAVWCYCEQSAAVIFASNPQSLEDKIHKLLVDARLGMTRSDISGVFHHHKSTTEISQALQILEGRGLIRRMVSKTRGRSAEIWIASGQKGES